MKEIKLKLDQRAFPKFYHLDPNWIQNNLVFIYFYKLNVLTKELVLFYLLGILASKNFRNEMTVKNRLGYSVETVFLYYTAHSTINFYIISQKDENI